VRLKLWCAPTDRLPDRRGKALAHDGRLALRPTAPTVPIAALAACLVSVLALLLLHGAPARAGNLNNAANGSPRTHREATPPARVTPPESRGLHELALTIQPGQPLVDALAGAGVGRTQAEAAVSALEDLFDPDDLRPGDRVSLRLEETAPPGPLRLRSLHFTTGRHQDLTIVARSDGTFAPPETSPASPWSLVVRRRSGVVTGDFRAALTAASLPSPVTEEVLAAFTCDPDLPDDPGPGSRFTVVYEAAEGTALGSDAARLAYATLRRDGSEHRVYRYPIDGGDVAFVEPSGRGVVPLHLMPPVADAVITSPWGWRSHPVLGVRKFHKGVDFGAASGTPVRAAADGVVETLGWRGNYGRYVRLQHSGRVETAYAHLSRFARGLHAGSKVRRGQVIAYVGRSGLATGPHLYYEVLIDHHHVDPERNGLAIPIQLAGESLSHFRSYVQQVASAGPSN
jgi:murein DD-endopeptidase MepM/ murein hydrolase activator NlpD